VKKIYTFTDNNGSKISFDIIGVVKNFHFESLRQNVGPMCMRLGTDRGLASFKIDAGKSKDLITQVENKWKSMAAGLPFSYRFLDDSFNDMYRNEQRIGKLAISFAVLAIFIACLGLFGLATYIAEQRTKEIGIRKVLGASVGSVVNMLSKDFIILVLIASVIAFPIAWWAMHNWLQDFAYRITIGWWIFLAAGAIAFLIAFITVSSQAIKAALANPVKSLRTE
jgi:putative ABC transport system permease protein